MNHLKKCRKAVLFILVPYSVRHYLASTMKRKRQPEYSTNPYPIGGTLRPPKEKSKLNRTLGVDRVTVTGYTEQETKKIPWVDTHKFVKVYHPIIDIMPHLSSSARRLLSYIMKNLQPKKDVVFLQPEEAMKYCGYTAKSRSLYEKALSELHEYQVIGKKEGFGNCYFINCNMLFNGSRTGLMKSTDKERGGADLNINDEIEKYYEQEG